MRYPSILLVLLLYSTALLSNDTIRVKLFPNGTKSQNGLEQVQEMYDGRYITNVSDPMIDVFLPKNRSENPTQAMLIIPGGSYEKIAVTHEGYKTIEWLNSHGIAAILLKYRMPNGHPDIPLEDAREAIKAVRDRATEWNINPSQIGVIGFSAGGHLASSLLTQYGETKCRPNFGVLVYPVINLTLYNAKTGENLTGEDSTHILSEKYSSHLHIQSDTPPTCIILTDDDKAVPSSNSIDFYMGLKDKGVSSEMHIFPKGGHGWWMRDRYLYAEETYPVIIRWIKSHTN